MEFRLQFYLASNDLVFDRHVPTILDAKEHIRTALLLSHFLCCCGILGNATLFIELYTYDGPEAVATAKTWETWKADDGSNIDDWIQSQFAHTQIFAPPPMEKN